MKKLRSSAGTTLQTGLLKRPAAGARRAMFAVRHAGCEALGAVCLAVLVLLMAVPAWAKIEFNLPPGYSQDDFDKLGADLGLAISYTPLAPAEPLGGGALPHFDAGVEATAASIESNVEYWKSAARGLNDYLLFYGVHVQVGLPAVPLDLGLVYRREADSDLQVWGGEVKVAVLKGGPVMPAVALRGGYTRLTGIDEIEVRAWSADISVSKGILMFTPYAGVGEVWVTAKERSAALDLDAVREAKVRGFVGCRVSLLPVLNIVGEAQIGSLMAYSLRLNVHF